MIKNKTFTVLYFSNKNVFEEEENYVLDFIKTEELESKILFTNNFITGLKFIKSNFGLDLIVMGVRKDDLLLKCKESVINNDLIQTSDKGYPLFQRVYPCFLLNYINIWNIIKKSNYTYLDLYNQGFSSLGQKKNTIINKNLVIGNKILPAWCLEDISSERSFR